MDPRITLPLLSTLLCCAVGAPAQEAAPPALPRGFFAARRAALFERVGTGVIFLRGAPAPAAMEAFYQSHEFFYFAGVVEPDIAMLLDPVAKRSILFVPPFNRFTATWDGARLAPGEDAARRTGFDAVRNLRALLDEDLARALEPGADGERPVLWTILAPSPARTATPASARGAATRQERDPLDGRPARETQLAAKLRERFAGLEIRDLTPIVNELRGVKTAAEIEQIRAASVAAAQGIAETMKSTETGMYEYQLAAVARYVFARLGAEADCYAPIVGAGANGCVLHYGANSKQLVDGDLIVMDYAPTIHGYGADVTRTFPASGRFTAAQRKLVIDVHEIQQELIAEVRPGARLSALGAMCRRMLTERGYRSAHGPCHHVGLAVHDLGGDELVAGMVITVEPGAYLLDQGMGCRIEDTILVTADGHEVLSAAVPAHPDAIEALMRASGIAQQPIGVGGR